MTWTFKFGKHTGKPIDDPTVPDNYVEWLLSDNDEGEPRIRSEAFRDALSSELERRRNDISGPAAKLELSSPRTSTRTTQRRESGRSNAPKWSGDDRLAVALSTQLAEVLVSLRRIEHALGTPVDSPEPGPTANVNAGSVEELGF